MRTEFDRQEAGDCSSRVVMPDLKINQALPAFQTTAVELTAQTVGDFGFACGMDMIHGRLQLVDRMAEATTSPPQQPTSTTRSASGVRDANPQVLTIAHRMPIFRTH